MQRTFLLLPGFRLDEFCEGIDSDAAMSSSREPGYREPMDRRNAPLSPFDDRRVVKPKPGGYSRYAAKPADDIFVASHNGKLDILGRGVQDKMTLANNGSCPHKPAMGRPRKTEGKSYPYSEVGSRLIALRTLAGLSQEEMYALIGVNHSYWGKFERGERLITMTYARPLAARFKVTLDFLYEGNPHGIDEHLLVLLRKQFPETLAESATGTGSDTDNDLEAYRRRILPNMGLGPKKRKKPRQR